MTSDRMELDEAPPSEPDVSYWVKAVRAALQQHEQEEESNGHAATPRPPSRKLAAYAARHRRLKLRIAGVLLRIKPHTDEDTPPVVVVKHRQKVTLSRCVPSLPLPFLIVVLWYGPPLTMCQV